ncbi:hypothetical protein ACH5RR_032978 [Cinchona calisaya]|uniref:Uncharacterized protein n=1 Tax=Cinchona calisaya TaxID=153742 RepID=A0ABD2YLR6_9GENT
MRVNLNVEMFDNIIECCPLIEVLQVLCIMGFDDFKVTKLNNLKDINQRVEVEAPKLELLTWDSVDLEEEDTVVRPMTCWITLPAPLYQNLKSLILRAVRIVDNFFMDLDLALKFPSLEDLTVSNCIGLQIIKILNRSLKRIQLIDNRQLMEAQFDVPSIVSFKYCSDSYIIPQFLFSATSSGWTSYIFMTMRGGVETSWFVELKGLVASLSQSEISVKLVFKYLVAFDLDEIGNIETIHEPQEVQELSFATDQICYFVVERVTLLNGLFWVCRPKNVNSRWIDNLYQNEAVKYLYEMLMFRRIQDQFCNLQKMMFWQHDLMEVNIEVGDQIIFGKEGKMELQQKDLDWEDFLEVLRKNGEYSRTIYFNLEWRTHDMPRS